MVKLDQLDIDILTVLQEDGRISNRRLAARVGLSASACLARVRRLEKSKVIRAYHGRIDVARLAPSIQCVALIKLDHHGSGAFARFSSAMRRQSEVVECLMLSGQYDFMLKVICRDIARYNELNDQLLALGVGIESVSSYIVMEETKLFAGVPLDALITASTITDDAS
ncbi:MAG: leucine-responsive regulatory protein [marine bacterium B5-7]|nr:MAG: leucine-responsive regulatory protein [marine bacterium B5-7]